jgi:adenosylcobinamide kinase/adenosylcobinamide-phosphate guanylyltransferase
VGELILILGGARSGKSAEAVRMARERGSGKVLYVATAEPGDDEMRFRIEKHRAERPAGWHTLEAPYNVGQAIGRQPDGYATIIVDCITLLVSNLMVGRPDPYADAVQKSVVEEIAAIVQAAKEMPSASQMIIVSNEVGTGLAPLTPLGRAFRDLVGQANQTLATAADRAVLMVAGLALLLKGEEPERQGSAQIGANANEATVRDE